MTIPCLQQIKPASRREPDSDLDTWAAEAVRKIMPHMRSTEPCLRRSRLILEAPKP